MASDDEDVADAMELEEEEEEEVELEEEEEEEEQEDDDDEETEEEDADEEEPSVDVRDSKLAEGLPVAKFSSFMANVWPILEKHGWRKIAGPDEAFDVLAPKSGIDVKKSKAGVDYYKKVVDVVERINRRETTGEATAADRYRRSIAKPRQPFSPTFEPTQKRRARKPLDPEQKWKITARKRFPKKSTPIGEEYQAADIPQVGAQCDDQKQYMTLVWDPAKAKASGLVLGAEADPLVALKNPHLLEAAFLKLAELDYNASALDETTLHALDGSDWTDKQRSLFEDEIFRLRRDLVAVAKLMDLPVSVCFAYYLGTYKHTVNYRLLKSVCIDEREAENIEFEKDACAVCGDGGNLLICDGCEREFHMTCMEPVLKEIPDGAWECDECVDRKFLEAQENLIRHSLLYEKGTPGSPSANGKDLYQAVPLAIDAVKGFAAELHDILYSGDGEGASEDGDTEMKVDTE